MSFRLEVSADVKKTEDPEKVKISITNIFPDINIEKNKDIVIGYSEDENVLSRFIELIHSDAIRDSVNMILKEGIHELNISFLMNKQAAFAGRVNLSKLSPLGSIRVKIYVENPYEFIDKIAPKTI
ncbi:MAG: hypothetical protein GX941_10495 [Candidatus Methanofastidiosa archaeon]|jgi:predicted RNA binding protein with dsRBD fold (UPF0201 family)|nr:hypothetical protein [Candidatus Methanofastidiosa archaeon]HOM96519.1 RNA-binding domain-containing protein [Methanofastidiosum sp.]HPC81453.1 RNA-binding domain-containing protein [Methanofastidiosum sp.]HRS26514.1 RNA-binding domain-containing protein [Methanofastidiosum sp.]